MGSLFPPKDETIEGVSQAIRSGQLSCQAVLERCLERIEDLEPAIRAWVVVDREGARAQACTLDEELAAGKCRGRLHGIPMGVKDIIDVAGLPTTAGAREWAEGPAARDAVLVSELRERGVVIVGKTVTTPYAWVDPPVTVNPWNPERTPGGSSSGSAAAVAAGMCLGALGSQTGGSLIRPAAFCGVAAFKPTYGTRSVQGVVPLARSLDHLGGMARTVADLRLLARGSFVPESSNHVPLPGRTPRIGRLRGMFEARASASMIDRLDAALATCAEQGARVVDRELPATFANVHKHHYAIMASEAAVFHRGRRAERPGDYPPRIAALVEDGLAVPAVEYLEALSYRDRLKEELFEIFEGVDVLAMPSAPGGAPDRTTTGDPSFNSPWSLVGFSVIGFPIGLDDDRMPLGAQFVGLPADRDGETRLFDAALWCEDILRWAASRGE